MAAKADRDAFLGIAISFCKAAQRSVHIGTRHAAFNPGSYKNYTGRPKITLSPNLIFQVFPMPLDHD